MAGAAAAHVVEEHLDTLDGCLEGPVTITADHIGVVSPIANEVVPAQVIEAKLFGNGIEQALPSGTGWHHQVVHGGDGLALLWIEDLDDDAQLLLGGDVCALIHDDGEGLRAHQPAHALLALRPQHLSDEELCLGAAQVPVLSDRAVWEGADDQRAHEVHHQEGQVALGHELCELQLCLQLLQDNTVRVSKPWDYLPG